MHTGSCRAHLYICLVLLQGSLWRGGEAASIFSLLLQRKQARPPSAARRCGVQENETIGGARQRPAVCGARTRAWSHTTHDGRAIS